MTIRFQLQDDKKIVSRITKRSFYWEYKMQRKQVTNRNRMIQILHNREVDIKCSSRMTHADPVNWYNSDSSYKAPALLWHSKSSILANHPSLWSGYILVFAERRKRADVTKSPDILAAEHNLCCNSAYTILHPKTLDRYSIWHFYQH